MSELKENVDFTFHFPEKISETVSVKLLTGEFAGVVYSYGGVSAQDKNGNIIDEDFQLPEGEDLYLAFDFHVIENNGNENLHESLEFRNHIGDVLMQIIPIALENYDNKVTDAN